jgi:hypothetical protein
MTEIEQTEGLVSEEPIISDESIKEISIEEQIEDGFKTFAANIDPEEIERELSEVNIVTLLTDILGEDVQNLELDLEKKLSYRRKLKNICLKK